VKNEREYKISRVVARPRFPRWRGRLRAARLESSRNGLFCRAVLIALAVAACTKDPVIDQRVVTLYTLEDPPNAITPSSCLVPADAYALYSGAGDFQPDPNAQLVGHPLNATSPLLSLPPTTQQLTLDVTSGSNQWRGYGILPATGDIAVLLWAAGHECELRPTVDEREGGTLTPYDDRHVLIAGGVGQPSFIADLSNGNVTALTTAQDIGAQRTFATATAYSGGVVVSGGEVGNVPQNSVALFDAQSGTFSGVSIALAVSRANHAATRLVNGNVVLVGGGTSSSTLYQSLEVIDLAHQRATQFGVDILKTARANPIALTLTSGEVLVAAGNDSDGDPVGSVEWFSKDASQNIDQVTIPVAASHHEAFVALPAGGALGVISQDTSGVTTTWLITSDHHIQQGASLAAVPPGSNIRLFSGANGAPLLWTGSNWFRWSPWTGAFVPFSEATSTDGSTLANGPSEVAVTASPDPGLALWLENNQGVTAGKIVGLRFDSRGAYSTDTETLLSGNTTSIAPDRLPGSDLSFATAQANDPGTGLALGAGAQAVIADANYLDFTLDFDSGELELPTIFLRDDSGNDLTIGTDSSSSCVIDQANHLHVVRSGGSVSVTLDSSAPITCGPSLDASARLTIGFRGPNPPSKVSARVRNVVVVRN
jgi:hypothetical protein